MEILNGKKLLLVEDEALIQLRTINELKCFGYDVTGIFSGEEAIKAVNSSNDVDLILMDINLGHGIDGTVAAQKILEIRQLPIIFVSSHTEPEIVQKTESITSYGYIVKDSCYTVYDASIKMAFKLFNAHIENLRIEKILKSSIETLDNSIFISDSRGNIIQFNESFARFQRFDNKSQCIDTLAKYPDVFEVYTADGEFAPLEKWALPQALNGISGKDVKYYIRRKDTSDVWIGDYSYEPIRDDYNEIIGAVVVCRETTQNYPEDQILKKLSNK